MNCKRLREFVHRDRSPVEGLRTAYWQAWQLSTPPVESLNLAESLRRFALAIHPLWPDQQERNEDLATHRRVAESLHRVRPQSRR